MKKDKLELEKEAFPLFLKYLVFFLLILMPVLGYFILKTDPVIYSNNVETNPAAVEQVKVFASFIKTRPDLAKKRTFFKKSEIINIENSHAPLLNSEKDLMQTIESRWVSVEIVHDAQWMQEIETVFSIAERTHDEKPLDVLFPEIIKARKDNDDVVHQKADEWFTRYLSLETRSNQREKIIDFFREGVLESVDRDERARSR